MDKNKALNAMPIGEWAKQNGFVQVVPTVRVNASGYPYVTFLKEDNSAENVYFSKKAAEGLTEGEKLASLKGYQIADTTNEAGEPRVKLISNSERVDLSTML